ncbi:MAG: helix-turn-helix transcriptional regulator, partial [Treponema sp.]|nr:helix-turn-helix transcriptional regulator [Treponema sp.]
MYIIIDVMGKNAVVLLPSVQKVLTELGENIKLARLRRGLSSELIAERAGISRATLVNVEKGSP